VYANRSYDRETLEQINNGVDLLAYVEQSLELKKRGKDYWASCPLHIDDTPSFSITPAKNSYYCFSCGRAGGIIGYLIQYEHMGFEDAVKKAANLASVDLNSVCKSETMRFLREIKRSYQASKTVPYQHQILPEQRLRQYAGGCAQEWLDEGIEQRVLDLFEVGVDQRTNRIVYPVRDIEGHLINVKGRTRYADYKQMGIPKYINYEPVGVVDYFQGLNITLPYVRNANEVIIFESIKSVMLAYGWGFKHCASAEKHSLTPEQIELLVKLRVNVVFAYDSDISYRQPDVAADIKRLKRMTNVYLIEDLENVLGGVKAKNAPVDLGREVWEKLYRAKRKVV